MYAVQRVAALARTHCYVIGHDPGYRVPDHWIDADGAKHPVILHRYSSGQQLKVGLSQHPAGIHLLCRGDGEEVMEIAREISAASLRANEGRGLIPCIVLLDEGGLIKGADPRRLSDSMRERIISLRHDNIGLVLTVQDPSFIHYSFASTSSEVIMFHINSKKAANAAIDVGMPPEKAFAAMQLPRYQHIDHKHMG